MNRIISFFKGRGFYLALAACILAAAGSSFWAIRNVIQNMGQMPGSQIRQEEQTPWQLPQVEAENKVNDVPKPSAVPSPSSSLSSGSADGQPQAEDLQPSAVLAEPSFVKPAEGEIVKPFSGDELVYNETLGDWRTHNGVDIACAPDAQVRNAMTGQVCNVYTDGMWGQVVEVECGELVWRYTGLEEASMQVKTGDVLKAGAPIAKIGTADAEIGEKPHLHIEVLSGGNYVDPEKYFE